MYSNLLLAKKQQKDIYILQILLTLIGTIDLDQFYILIVSGQLDRF